MEKPNLPIIGGEKSGHSSTVKNKERKQMTVSKVHDNNAESIPDVENVETDTETEVKDVQPIVSEEHVRTIRRAEAMLRPMLEDVRIPEDVRVVIRQAVNRLGDLP